MFRKSVLMVRNNLDRYRGDSMTPLHCQNITCRRPSWNGRSQREVTDFSESFAAGTTTAFQSLEENDAGLLLSILGMIESPDSGQICVLGESVLEMEPADAPRFRDRAFGYLFTHPHLLPSFTVAENIAMPFLRLFGNTIDAARERVAEVLDFVELDVSCANLSMGDLDEAAHWRVAFARSIAHQPKILVAVSPPALFLLPLARRYARQTGAAVLWNAGAADVRRLCERVLTPDCLMTSIPAS